MKGIFAATIALSLALSLLNTARAADYAFKPLAPLQLGLAINNNGRIAGTHQTGASQYDEKYNGFILSNGKYTYIDYPGSNGYTTITGINNAGTVVGYYEEANYSYHGFTMTSDLTPTVIDYPGVSGTYLYGINNAGTVVGSYDYSQNGQHGFALSSDGTPTAIDYPGADTTTAYGINDAGIVVGSWANTGGYSQGFSYSLSDGTYTPIHYHDSAGHDSTDTHALGINNAGVIVGWYYTGDHVTNARGFTLINGTYESFAYPDPAKAGYGTFATGINDAGTIVGSYGAPGLGFIATSVITLTGTVSTQYCTPTSCLRNPYPDVTIDISSTNTSYQATTAKDGTYSVQVSPDVTYTITPSVPGSADVEFDPDSYTIHPTESVDKLDFVVCVDQPPASGTSEMGETSRNTGQCALGVDWEMDKKLKKGKQFDDDSSWSSYNGIMNPHIIYPPGGWKVNLFLTRGGTQIGKCADPLVQWRWEVTPKGKVTKMPDAGCTTSMMVKEPGTYMVTAKKYTRKSATGQFTFPKNGVKVPKQPKSVVARNFLIVGVGDSNGSGEGNPWPYVGASSAWTYEKCDRSQTSYQFKAALYVQEQNPRASVTFIWPSCSGARIEHVYGQPYQGTNPDGWPLDSQITQVAQLLRVSGQSWEPKTPRKIDAVIISAGVNNLYFGPLMEFCITHQGCEDVKARLVPKTGATNGPGDKKWLADSSSNTTTAMVMAGLQPNLDWRYAEMAQALSAPVNNSGTGGLGVASTHVIISQYPDFSHDENGDICDTSPGLFSVTQSVAAWGPSTWAWLHSQTSLLNSHVLKTRSLGWQVAKLNQSDFLTHGYCAGSYKTVFLPAYPFYMPVPSFGQSYFLGVAIGAANSNIKGGFHPIVQGHNITAWAVEPLLCNALYGNDTCEGTPK